jgi:nucleotidyltransferase substrate binding protein (TIGR01987 family)
MEGVKERIDLAGRAGAALEEALGLPPSPIVRDAAIQRFEFTFEATWKAARAYLLAVEGVDAASPKAVIRACRRAGLLREDEAAAALAMADDRNLTSHTYDETLAAAIFSRLPGHGSLLRAWVDRMAALPGD